MTMLATLPRPSFTPFAGKPDLYIMAIGAINYTTTSNLLGPPVTLYWSKSVIFVNNQGSVASQPCKLRLEWRDYLTNALKKTYVVDVPAIQPGVYQEVDVIAPLTQANFRDQNTVMFGFVDCSLQIQEAKENNNTYISNPGGFLS